MPSMDELWQVAVSADEACADERDTLLAFRKTFTPSVVRALLKERRQFLADLYEHSDWLLCPDDETEVTAGERHYKGRVGDAPLWVIASLLITRVCEIERIDMDYAELVRLAAENARLRQHADGA